MSDLVKNEKKIFSGVDLFKLISALLVVLLHCLGNTLGVPGNLFVRNVTTAAVPFFFVASGYFFSLGLSQAENKKEYMSNYCCRLLKLYFVWAIFYLILKLPGYVELHGDNLIFLCGFIIRKIFFVGMGVYWYFLALAESIFLLYLFVTKNKRIGMFIFAFIFYIIGVLFAGFRPFFSDYFLLDTFFELIYVVFSWTNNALFLGFPCVVIGWLIQEKKIYMKPMISLSVLVVAFLLKFLEVPINNYILIGDNELSFFQIFTGAAMFCFALSISPSISYKTSTSMRSFSTTIYLLHSIFLFFIDESQQKNGVVVFIITVLLCAVCEFLIRKCRNKYVRFLFLRR